MPNTGTPDCEDKLIPININDVVEIVSDPTRYRDKTTEKQAIIHELVYESNSLLEKDTLLRIKISGIIILPVTVKRVHLMYKNGLKIVFLLIKVLTKYWRKCR